ncbi:MAG: hypothetical protein QM770_12925 [Tepidisphaeraceae bacterium]
MFSSDEHKTHVAQLFRQLFDQHPAHVCMIDLDGRIVAVNKSWLRFGAENDLSPDYSFEGQSYLDACATAAEQGDTHAAQALTGLLDVLATGRSKFTMVYPCHAPFERRWFKLWVEPQMPATPVVIVAHQLERAERVEMPSVVSQG